MFQRTFLTGLALSVFIIQACGSDPGKRSARGQEGGAGGEAAGGEPAKGGSQSSAGMPAGGEPGTGASPSDGGTPAGGAPEPAAGGEGGAPGLPLPPDPELLFSAKTGSQGLTGTGVRSESQGNPQNFIYVSKSGSQDPTDGTNRVLVKGADLGLTAEDRITSFTELRPEPAHPVYLFSVADGTESGNYGTRVDAENSSSGSEEGDVYFSEGTTSYRNYGEGGDQFGYNALLATDLSIGLIGGFVDAAPDDLVGLLARDANIPLTELYFTIADPAVPGLTAVDPSEQGCTVFQSSLDGKNGVAFTCQQLGLVPGDEIDGLLVYGTTTPSKVVFSVTNRSTGATDSALNAVVNNETPPGAFLFESTGSGTNTLLKEARELGLGSPMYAAEIDGLSVIDQRRPPDVKPGTSCALTFDPYNVDQGALTNLLGTTNIGDNVLVLLGTISEGSRAIAYDATTCEKLQSVDLPPGDQVYGFLDPANIAIVPAADWSAAKPLDKVQYFKVGSDSEAGVKLLDSYDASGTFQASSELTRIPFGASVRRIIFDAANGRLNILTLIGSPQHNQVWSTALPNAPTTVLDTTSYELVMPCMWNSQLNGVDAKGNLYFAEAQLNNDPNWSSYVVCKYSPTAELQSLPYSWPNGGDRTGFGYISSQGDYVLFNTNQNEGPFTIEHASQPLP